MAKDNQPSDASHEEDFRARLILLGRRWERIDKWEVDFRGLVEVYFEPRDVWVGVYIDKRAVYICLLPMVAIRISRGRKRM